MEPLRHCQVPGFGATTFRRTFPEIHNEGGLWDKAMGMYRGFGATPARADRSASARRTTTSCQDLLRPYAVRG